MNNNPVLFIDSGVGGIPYCRDFINRNPSESVCYLADRINFPYGPRKKDDIISILAALTKKLVEVINPKIIVLACNTASISALESLRESFPNLAIVGTVPAIKPAANDCRKGVIGVLGTERTIADIRSLNIDSRCEIFGIAAPELVDFVEQRYDKSDETERKKIVKKYVDLFRSEGLDTIVLGCTHFLYILDEFKCEAENPQDSSAVIKIFDSIAGITKRIEFLLDENDRALRCDIENPQYQFILTGKEAPDSQWQDRAKMMDFKLCMLDDILI